MDYVGYYLNQFLIYTPRLACQNNHQASNGPVHEPLSNLENAKANPFTQRVQSEFISF